MSIWSSRATMQTARRREEQGPRCPSGDATPQVRKQRSSAALWPAPGSHLRVYAQALLRRPRALAATRRDGAGEPSAGDKRLLRGASLCREPSQYRDIASGSPPRPASHIASVAHVPIIEIGSGLMSLWFKGLSRNPVVKAAALDAEQ